MTAQPNPTLVIGGTRGTGLMIVRRLVAVETPCRVLARDVRRARMVLPSQVDVFSGDMTRRDSLLEPASGAGAIILTAGVASGRPATERAVKSVEHDGVLNVLWAARATGFRGRFAYMTASGTLVPSLLATLLNLYKGNTLAWRRRAEEVIRSSGFDYTIVRAGVLNNRAGGQHRVRVVQEALPLSWRYRIARADVADALVAALGHPCASRATFDIAWRSGGANESWPQRLDCLRPDRLASDGTSVRPSQISTSRE